MSGEKNSILMDIYEGADSAEGPGGDKNAEQGSVRARRRDAYSLLGNQSSRDRWEYYSRDDCLTSYL